MGGYPDSNKSKDRRSLISADSSFQDVPQPTLIQRIPSLGTFTEMHGATEEECWESLLYAEFSKSCRVKIY